MTELRKDFTELSAEEQTDWILKAAKLLERFEEDVERTDKRRTNVLAAWTGYDSRLVGVAQSLIMAGDDFEPTAGTLVDCILFGIWLAQNKPEGV